MAPHSSTLAWNIPWMEEPGGLQSIGSLRVGDTTERLHFHFSLSCIGEGDGNPLQCSCLENPREGGAWWAAVYGVAQSWTRLKCPAAAARYWFLNLAAHQNHLGRRSFSTALQSEGLGLRASNQYILKIPKWLYVQLGEHCTRPFNKTKQTKNEATDNI